MHTPNPLVTAATEVLGDVSLFFAGFLHFIVQADAGPVSILLCTAGVCRLMVAYRVVATGLSSNSEGVSASIK